MGNSSSSAFAGVFTALNDKTQADVAGWLADYRAADLDFGVRAEDLQALLKTTPEKIAPLAQVFDNGNGTINALDFITGAGLCVSGSLADKVSFVFDAYDFDKPHGQITSDEMVILLISVLTGVTKMTGKGKCPGNDHLESLTTQALQQADKDAGGTVAKSEFADWVHKFLDTNGDKEVSVDELLVAFNCLESEEKAAIAAAGATQGETKVDEAALPIAEEFPTFPEDTNSLLKQHLSQEIYDQLKDVKTSHGITLYDVIKCGVQSPNCTLGVLAQDEETYTTFAPLLDLVIEGYHQGYKLSDGHKRDLDPSHLGAAAANPDPEGAFIKSTRIRVARNLKGYRLPGRVTPEQRAEVEAKIVEALNSLDGEHSGTYYSLPTMSDEDRTRLEQDHFLFREEHGYFAFGGIYRDWAQSRGIYHNADKTFLVWVNEEDELRIISMQKGGDIGAVFNRLVAGIAKLEEKLDFLFDDQRGYVASCPSNLGTGMRASVHIVIPNACKDPRFKQICDELYLQPRGSHGEHSEASGGLYDISPKKRLGLTEVECAQALHEGARRLIALERELLIGGGIGAGAAAVEEEASAVEEAAAAVEAEASAVEEAAAAVEAEASAVAAESSAVEKAAAAVEAEASGVEAEASAAAADAVSAGADAVSAEASAVAAEASAAAGGVFQ